MEFNILKGKNLSKFAALSSAEYAGALFFDLSNNTIYFGSDKDANNNASDTIIPVAMNNGVTIAKALNDDHTRIETIYTIQAADGSTDAVSITDAQIPDIDSDTWEGKDADATYLKLGSGKAGLISSVDKYILDEIANVLGITTEATTDETGTTQEVKFKMDLSTLASKIAAQSNKFDGGTAADTLATLTSHGNLAKGTTIADLEKMSLSEVLKAVLFETAAPVKTTTLSASVSFASPYNTTVDVGRDYPTASNMGYTFTPEKWQWTSANDSTVKGTAVELNKFDSVKYYYTTTNSKSTDGATEMDATKVGSTKTVAEGTNGYFFAVVTYTAGSDATDSLGNNADADGNVYKAAYSGSAATEPKSFTGAWRVYSNCAATTTTAATAKAWSTFADALGSTDVVTADTNMSTETGITNHGFNATGFYAAWPSKTSANYSSTDKYLMYVPASKSIKSIKAYNGATGAWDVAIDVPTPTTIELSNGYTTGDFKVYEFENDESLLNYYFTIG